MSTSARRARARTPVLALLVAIGAVASMAGGCDGRVPERASSSSSSKKEPLTGPAVLELDLSKGVPELAPQSLFAPPDGRTHADLVAAFRSFESSPPKGLLVRLGAPVGFAKADEIGRLLLAQRDRGVPVVCHADDLNNSTLLLASLGCSQIWVSPAGGVDSIGLAAQLLFANKFLTTLDVDVDFLQVGKYKGAEEMFTRDEPSPEARLSLERTLVGMRAAWLEGIATGRGNDALEDAVEDGPHAPEDAKALGLVDAIGSWKDATEAAKKAAGAARVSTKFGGGKGEPPGFGELLRNLSGGGAGPHVAVVRAAGAISMGGAPSLLGDGEGITERELGKTIEKLTEDDAVKAVVLRIESPGGSALASDLLWLRLMKLRETKPLVVSVGGMAASGGYYLACSGTQIVAERTSIVGSIGVVAGKLAFGRTLENVGVHAEVVSANPDPERAARAAMMSPLQGWDEPTRTKLRGTMTSIYELFLKRIAEGRGLEVAAIEPSAEGQIFAGSEAYERKLVDALGGLGDATRLAVELAGLPRDTPVAIVGAEPAWLALLGGDEDAEAKAGRATRAAARNAAWDALGLDPGHGREEAAVLAASLAPLAAGETTLTAIPFGIAVR